jgi:serine/threonine protein phosphatase 1
VRHLAIGDIHGCLTALTTLAAFVPFHPDDIVITIGDYVSRGPDSRGVIGWLIDYQRRGNLVALRGNHEVRMLKARRSDREYFEWYMKVGGRGTLQSYASAGEPLEFDLVPDDHWRFLEGTGKLFETEHHFFVHANAHPDVPLSEQPDPVVYWEGSKAPRPHQSGKIMVYGHLPQKSGVPRNFGHAVCIDTWASGDGWLTCLEVETGRYWQANQRGETGSGFLEDPA